eukprot:CAMPEP_0181323280 /NCGR_PEP_ID=MMETSP1101-20121128/19694_1 /TAXON_ID=46948 /ORGANISM="Rhodomonas abbreviata, Strain Caron Lab Isolate" /LENGTH=247 /DNA_ID=CAMNT_0023431283 /DNA_START=179 /DNA_END=922 /DNA_ORIENTATION=-
MLRNACLITLFLPICTVGAALVQGPESFGGLRLSGGEQTPTPRTSTSPHRGSGGFLAGEADCPLVRVKSFGQMSSFEYQELVEKLWAAAQRGDVNECASLVKQGAWPNHLRVGEGLQANALHLAAVYDHPELITALVRLGADVESVNNQGLTALHMASQMGHMKAVKALLSAGADPQVVDWMGDTAQDKAELAGWDDISSFLLRVVTEDRMSRQTFRQQVKRVLAGKKAPDDRFYSSHVENPLLANV